ncbi:MAG: DUF2845 domain-containing protein [Myxococcales bacterium]
MSSLEVLRQCGQPPVVDSRQEEWHAADGTVLQVDTVERWTYDLGPQPGPASPFRIGWRRHGIFTSCMGCSSDNRQRLEQSSRPVESFPPATLRAGGCR